MTLKYIETKIKTTDSKIKTKLLTNCTELGNYVTSAITLKRGKFTKLSIYECDWKDFNSEEEPDLVTGGKKVPLKDNDYKIILTTGASDDTKLQNIYDLAGNVWEWTLEAIRNNIRAVRGGGYDIEYIEYSRPDARSFTYPNIRDSYHGSRLTIY